MYCDQNSCINLLVTFDIPRVYFIFFNFSGVIPVAMLDSKSGISNLFTNRLLMKSTA